ncbi:MAG: hypothetical protein M1371_00915 [Actinobacteria bacterium]|nr:hypothetical protein [Actinomycetota bacterium]
MDNSKSFSLKSRRNSYSNILISKIAHLYYREERNIKEIADIFGISYSTVSRMLKRGKQSGIITININSFYDKFFEREKDLKEELMLKDIIIVPSIENEPDYLVKRKVGEVAANYLANLLKDGDNLGISWGSTVYECVNSFKIDKDLNVNVIQLHGSISGAPIELNSNDLVRRMKYYFTGSYYFLTSELVVDNKDIRDAIIKDSKISKTLEIHKTVTKAILGIGAFGPNKNESKYYWDYLKEDEITELIKHKAVGDVSLIFYDINGKIIDNLPLDERKISISKKTLLGIDNRIGIASGIKKAASVLGAIRAKLVNTIVLDDKLFEELYKLYTNEAK